MMIGGFYFMGCLVILTLLIDVFFLRKLRDEFPENEYLNLLQQTRYWNKTVEILRKAMNDHDSKPKFRKELKKVKFIRLCLFILNVLFVIYLVIFMLHPLGASHNW